MHPEILTVGQVQLLPLIKIFTSQFGLVGGTAVALLNILIKSIVKRAKKIFGGQFNEKLFREQLSYFDDIDYSEKVDWLEGFKIGDKAIKESLKEISLQIA
ncbi:MAG: hypothetical protein ABIJ85_01250 [bacterium]